MMYSWLIARIARVIYFLSFWITFIEFELKFSILGRTYFNCGLIYITYGDIGLSVVI